MWNGCIRSTVLTALSMLLEQVDVGWLQKNLVWLRDFFEKHSQNASEGRMGRGMLWIDLLLRVDLKQGSWMQWLHHGDADETCVSLYGWSVSAFGRGWLSG